jgi:tetratricopeptide (TPR) repeat protein
MAGKRSWRRRDGERPRPGSASELLTAARRAVRQPDLRLAAELLSAAKARARVEGDRKSEASAHAIQGALLFDTEGAKAARPEADEALRLARLAGAPDAEVDALYLLGLCDVSEGHWVKACRLFEDLLPIAEKHSTPDRVRVIRNHLAALAMHTGDMSKASAHVQTVARGADRPEADREHARAVLSQGEIANRLGRTAEAKKLFEEARLLFHRLQDTPGEAVALMSMGDMMMYEKDLDLAEVYIQAAREAFRKEQLRVGEANCLLSLGEIAYRREDPGKAKEIFTQALAQYREVGDQLGEANCILKLGDLAREPPEDEAAARQHFTRALEIYTSLHELFSQGRALRRLASVAETREEAIARWTEAIRVLRSAGRPDLVQEIEDEMKEELEDGEEQTDENPEAPKQGEE